MDKILCVCYYPFVGVSKLGSALNYTNEQIFGDGVERLRLILYPIISDWKELEKCTTPADMYYKLESAQGSCKAALEVFLFALRFIGGSKRGPQCAAEITKSLGSIMFSLSNFDLRGQSRKFHLFFCLLMIERRLPLQKRDAIMEHFGRVLKRNHRKFNGLPHAFIKLYEQQKISEDNTDSLQRALEKHRLLFNEDTQEYIKVTKCLDYLVMFHDEEDRLSSGDISSSP